jgi:DNA polymerase-3 subunit delta'
VEDAGVLLDGAGGMPLAALQWSAEGLSAATWRALPQAVAAGDAGLLLGWPIPRVLDALQKICHDAGCHIAGGRGRFFPENKWPPGASLQRLVHWHKSLQRVMAHAEHPWSEALLIESLVAQGRSVWNPEPERRGGRLATA